VCKLRAVPKGVVDRLRSRERVLLLGFLLAAALLGLFLAPDFGQSWDEAIDYQHYEITAKAYIGSLTRYPGGLKKYYGPFYFMASTLLAKGIHAFLSGWMEVDTRHWVNYLTFLAGVAAFYGISRSLMRESGARLITLLFATQPLLFGHAFINQKDIPFMSFFLASVYLGWRAVDRAGEGRDSSKGLNPTPEFAGMHFGADVRAAWRRLSLAGRATIILVAGLTILLLCELFLWQGLFLPFAETLVQRAHQGVAFTPLQTAFDRTASQADMVPLDYYIDKVRRFYSAMRMYVAVVLVAISGAMIARQLSEGIAPHMRTWRKLYLPWVIAGVLLGLTTAIRVAGPFAGLLVSVYGLLRYRRRAIAPLALYWLVAASLTYAAWPLLWDAPVARFLESVRVMGAFTGHKALYRGVVYPSTELPWHYFPGLMAVQLTEPVVLLIPLGLAVGVFWAMHKKADGLQFSLLAAWFLLPAAAIAATGTPLYGNARQLYFLIPPLFIFAAFGAEWLLAHMPWRTLRGVLLAAMLLPGLWGIASLHPYEYSYYNSFAGGISGAFLRYETDHWCTSLREAVGVLNQIAPANATVVVEGPQSAAVPFARPDLKFVGEDPTPDYALGCKWAIIEGGFYPEYRTVYEVRRGEAVLAVLKAAP